MVGHVCAIFMANKLDIPIYDGSLKKFPESGLQHTWSQTMEHNIMIAILRASICNTTLKNVPSSAAVRRWNNGGWRATGCFCSAAQVSIHVKQWAEGRWVRKKICGKIPNPQTNNGGHIPMGTIDSSPSQHFPGRTPLAEGRARGDTVVPLET